ncbi:V-type proton ATPase 116 kDa subunit a1-like [Corticium candelabrum]|uniref:V-type proton ATPase 116 kDa subunit a1-like n=1 Tax=Corticium candelabrum TaxID=121492 RepID=UPI002E273BB5|nr:V-type proton ATPase 116 kDa subunit a1-like [Corticium candelabrum]
MSSIFRSEEMTLCQILLQSESAYAIVSELGELGMVQFRDLNPDVNAFQRKFVNEIRRCDEMERKLRFLRKEIEKAGLRVNEPSEFPDAPHPQELIDLETKFEQLETEMKEINTNQDKLNRNFLELMELKQILSRTVDFFEEADYRQEFAETDESALLTEEGKATAGNLGFVAGVINRERVPGFERLLWRACRGNVFLRYTEIENAMEDPVTGQEVHKFVFIIFFQGDQLRSRVKKICEGYRATLYPCPESAAERREMTMGVSTRIEDLRTVLAQTQDHRCRVLQTVAKSLCGWEIRVKKIKAIYHTLDQCNFDLTTKCLIGECWCPVADLDAIQRAVRRGTERSGSSVPSVLNRIDTTESPPTFFRNNKFTQAFQNIVDAYGIANYREVNPALFTIITFPFLFAIMFGDFGHGVLMALAAFAMILMEKKLSKSNLGEISTIFEGRYIMFLMGLFAMYTGLIYNDCLSKAFNIFGSHWNFSYSIEKFEGWEKAKDEFVQLSPCTNFDNGNPYPFGMDPIWQEHLAENSITFTNSFKMKMSIIVGVSQMLFGIILSLTNHLFFRRYINVVAEFIPQMLFLISIFGYLCVLIIYKWIIGGCISSEEYHAPPSLLITIINMFLNLIKPEYIDKQTGALYDESAQKGVQYVLVFCAVISVPWMLLVKPFYLKWRHNKQFPTGYTEFPEDNTVGIPQSEDDEVVHHDGQPSSHSGHDEEKFEFSEVFIHQAIHTIEFCLGCISHTASYLRLWALSLAHAELSAVLWKMVFHSVLQFEGGLGIIATFIGFTAWALLTIAILLVMEGLSAFLHTLRLHWVEFQSKFYVGEGYKFVPFSFEAILKEEGNE